MNTGSTLTQQEAGETKHLMEAIAFFLEADYEFRLDFVASVEQSFLAQQGLLSKHEVLLFAEFQTPSSALDGYLHIINAFGIEPSALAQEGLETCRYLYAGGSRSAVA